MFEQFVDVDTVVVAPASCVVIVVAAEAAYSFGAHASAAFHAVVGICAAVACNDLQEETDGVETLLAGPVVDIEDKNMHCWHHCIVDNVSGARESFEQGW